MNTLHQIAKLLRKHHARLLIEHRDGDTEMVLRIPAPTDRNGTLLHYAVEYRLGSQFPRPEPVRPAPPAPETAETAP